MSGLILSLGAPNDNEGNLSLIAQDRLNAVLCLYKYNLEIKIVCTGGMGEHFNNSAYPHYYYSHQYLKEQGVPADALTTGVSSANTVEDFKLSRDLIFSLAPSVLIIVTSDFHIERVKILHAMFLNYPSTIFWGAPSSVSDGVFAQLMAHEKTAIQKLKNQ